MKKIYFLVLALGLFTGADAQIITIPDANFKAKLLEADVWNNIAIDLSGDNIKIDSNNDGEIEVSEVMLVESLNVSNSFISNITGILNFTSLGVLNCSNNQLINLDVNGLDIWNLDCNFNQLSTLNVSGLNNLINLNCSYNYLSNLNVSGLNNLEILTCTNNELVNLNVSGLTSLQQLYCGNNQLSSLNVNGLTNLESLICGNNLLTSLDISELIDLRTLYCSNNQLTILDASGLINLLDLSCFYNQLTSLNVSGLIQLSQLQCSDNQLDDLVLNGLTNLNFLFCSNNQLSNLDLNGLLSLSITDCSNNLLTSLDISSLYFLGGNLTCDNNQLTTLFLKNGSNETVNLSFSGNPNLQYICANEAHLNSIQDSITSYGYTNCHVNSYCSFTPGGTFYTIQGNNKYDVNSNGCDVLDLGLPNLKFNITDGTVTGTVISNSTGNYSLPVQTGTHTITPEFENPTYFTISPSTVNVTFPTQASPFIQNFCVTANGVHPDLEITLLPIMTARPGFDATYKLVYKNKGNTTQSGTVNLAFNDAVLDLVSANPVTSTQTVNNLSWNFTNLLPFETREITLILNVNSPMETPAVNDGDVLNYTTVISSVATDDMPNDNTFVFNQTVVNSLDPNDKTCLEGITISPSKVGDYVHYMIRFENNGTANAQNIVVKDMIDLAKFDISSLVPMKGSHSFVTNITSGNKVEFIFQNINLPFDNANNDGYVAFKIKTKPTLVLGNTFSNTASIYFDYNFPIVTNTATTTIAALNRQDFEFSNYFTVYPNPVSDVLNISAKEAIEVSSINIYNTLGQLVLVIPNAKDIKTVDVSDLSSGNYFIKINSDKGVSNTKFIKK